MASELDKLLHHFDEQKKKQEEQKRILANKQYEFTLAFKEKLKDIIHPAMMQHTETLRTHGHHAKQLREKINTDYAHECFIIYPDSTSKNALLLVFGNHVLQKICFAAEYFDTPASADKKLPYKKTEVQYELAEVSETVIDKFLTDVMAELLAAKASSPDN